MKNNLKVSIKLVVVIFVLIVISNIMIVKLTDGDSKSDVVIVPDNEIMLVLNSGKIIDEYGCTLEYYIVVDSETGVEYYVTNSKYNRGTITPLYNADGTLKVFDGGKENDR
jgi:vancomycin permeability regulator SanA